MSVETLSRARVHLLSQIEDFEAKYEQIQDPGVKAALAKKITFFKTRIVDLEQKLTAQGWTPPPEDVGELDRDALLDAPLLEGADEGPPETAEETTQRVKRNSFRQAIPRDVEISANTWFEAAQMADVDEMKELIDAGKARVNLTMDDPRNPESKLSALMLVAASGSPMAIQACAYLTRCGAKIQTAHGSAISHGLSKGFPDIVQSLVYREGADLNFKDGKTGDTPLHILVKSAAAVAGDTKRVPIEYVECVKLMGLCMINFANKNKEGESPLETATNAGLNTIVQALRAELLRRSGPNKPSSSGYLLISHAPEDKAEVSKLAARLQAAGIETAFHVPGAAPLTSLATTVLGAKGVLVCMTEAYEKQRLCRLEVEYAAWLKKLILPLQLTNFACDGWLEAITDGFEKYQLSAKFVPSLQKVLGLAAPAADGQAAAPGLARVPTSATGVVAGGAGPPALPSVPSSPTSKASAGDVARWSGQKVLAWCMEEKLVELSNAFRTHKIDGVALAELARLVSIGSPLAKSVLTEMGFRQGPLAFLHASAALSKLG